MEIRFIKIVALLNILIFSQPALSQKESVEFQVKGELSLSNKQAGIISTAESDVDFGEEGDMILQVYLRDILLTDAMYALMQHGRLFLPLAELTSLLDFPILVNSVQGRAHGWYLSPDNTFTLDMLDKVATVKEEVFSFTEKDVIADDIDLYVDSVLLQKWFPLNFKISLLSQKLVLRSSEKLPKEAARDRSTKIATREVSFAAVNDYDIPSYRLFDWPELSLSFGSAYSSQSDSAAHDYRLRAVGDIALMSGKFGLSGSGNNISGATFTLGRRNPAGMLGWLRIADFELGDTSQFVPGLIGGSLSGRGVRFGNTQLANQRDLDTIDLRGEQQVGYEVELYVNGRLRGVDRDSSDTIYSFPDVKLNIGLNEIRLEFYGPQGQHYTETDRSFVGNTTGPKGRFTYEMAFLEPSRRVFDVVDDLQEDSGSADNSPLRLSSALNIGYGLTRNTNLAFSIASVAANELSDTDNQNYLNTKITTDVQGILLSGDVVVDGDGALATAATARTRYKNYEISLSQRLSHSDYRNTSQLGITDANVLTKRSTQLSLSKPYFQVFGGRMSYNAAGVYSETHGNVNTASLQTRFDYQKGLAGLSWSHDLSQNLTADIKSESGRVGLRISPAALTKWSIGSDLFYKVSDNDANNRYFETGSLRLSRSTSNSGSISFNASRNLESTDNSYGASWQQRFSQFHFNTSVAGTSKDDISVRFGIDLAVRRHPGRWLPNFTSSSGQASVAVLVFADDNGNGKHDPQEMVVEGAHLTRNGLPAGVATDSNGIALLNGLSTSTSVDLGLVVASINEPDLKFSGIDKGVLPRQGRIPVIEVPLKRATDIEGTVIAAGTPVPNIRMLLTPIEGGEPMEIYTEFDGYYYLAQVPLGVYVLGPDPEQLASVGLVANPATRKIVLQDLVSFPPPEDFNLLRKTKSQAGESK